MNQQILFDKGADEKRVGRSGSFVDNMQLPVHRWFRYSAGFSAAWVREVVVSAGSACRVLDPFAGSGTVVVESEHAGAQSVGLEAHPFLVRVAQTKLCWREDTRRVRARAQRIVDVADRNPLEATDYPALIQKCYPKETLDRLHSLKAAWQANDDESPTSALCWLALAAALRQCSPVGTAQWQYVLPRKTKARAAEPFAAFQRQMHTMINDMTVFQDQPSRGGGAIRLDDARSCETVPDGWADLVITSPPYANNYDYADATRLEMCFFGDIRGWGDLQAAVRERLIRACTQHVASYADRFADALRSEELAPISDRLAPICKRLAAERETHGGKKPYHAMVAFYFYDLSNVWRALRRVTRPGGRACFVIGDSAPYGVHVPVETFLGELALAAGFRSYSFERLRDRNIKWKNRKHRVPLQEGRLWVEG